MRAGPIAVQATKVVRGYHRADHPGGPRTDGFLPSLTDCMGVEHRALGRDVDHVLLLNTRVT
jgi:hypothetical protein